MGLNTDETPRGTKELVLSMLFFLLRTTPCFTTQKGQAPLQGLHFQ
jgi:hypothetical protein